MGYGLNLLDRHLPVRHIIFYASLRRTERRDRVITRGFLSAPTIASNLQRVRATIPRPNRSDLILRAVGHGSCLPFVTAFCRGLHAGNTAPVQPLCLWIHSIRLDLRDRGRDRQLPVLGGRVVRRALAAVMVCRLDHDVAGRDVRRTRYSEPDAYLDPRRLTGRLALYSARRGGLELFPRRLEMYWDHPASGPILGPALMLDG